MVRWAVGYSSVARVVFGRAGGEIEPGDGVADGAVGNAEWGEVAVDVYAGEIGRGVGGGQAAGYQVGGVRGVAAEGLGWRRWVRIWDEKMGLDKL